MTDEELADKSAEEYFEKPTELVELWKVKAYKEAFLAGLKVGRPEWHKMDYKDKQSCKNIPCHIELITKYDCGLFVTHCVNRWTGDHWCEHNYGVIAWCEIPHLRSKTMTEEELKLEAIKYLENFKDCANCKNRWGDCAEQLDEYCLVNGCCFATPKEQNIYLAGAEPREKQIAELEKKLAVSENDREHNDYELVEVYKKVEQLKKKVALWKKASENNSYKAFQFEKENKELKSWKCKAETYMNYLIGLAQGSGLEKDNLVLEAEQFLNSEVEKI